MGVHFSKLVAVDKINSSDAIQQRLEFMNNYKMDDGLKVAKMMRGRRRATIPNDAGIMAVFKQGWRVKMG